MSGASTIEQQLVRTIRHRYERTVARKVSEITAALYLSRRITKTEIARLYLQIAYFGWKANGVSQALHRLGLALDTLKLDEAARVVSMLKYPMPQFPDKGYISKIEARTNYILRHINCEGFK